MPRIDNTSIIEYVTIIDGGYGVVDGFLVSAVACLLLHCTERSLYSSYQSHSDGTDGSVGMHLEAYT